jgi:hypothetical protein
MEQLVWTILNFGRQSFFNNEDDPLIHNSRFGSSDRHSMLFPLDNQFRHGILATLLGAVHQIVRRLDHLVD